MPFKLALIVVAPMTVSCILLFVAGVPWRITGRIAAVLAAFLIVTGLCDLARRRRGTTTGATGRRVAEQVPAAGTRTTAHHDVRVTPPREHPAAGLAEAVIAGLPTYTYEKRRGAGDECAVCLGEVRPREVVKRLPACTHLFHKGVAEVESEYQPD
ncbi:hypothetical protein E2562_019863 [Oryza meyeriana var. granulata]|uniref:RING-type E3 ubiquitin transferase n=1 Tax=Oryza meyeriana var. granulata TaxID=110450 RepID=A0A6G1CRY5_9ORYZ|nr:hypothetical protein E2562_019863 [Oryza meyeriana var. granulata]